MSSYDKRRIFRVYTLGKTYVLASQAIENEKLQIKLAENSTNVCLNKISLEEWNILTQFKTNSVRSPSFASAFDAYGCLGLLSVSMEQIKMYQQQSTANQSQSQSNFHMQASDYGKNNANDEANMQHFIIFVKEATSVGTLIKVEIMKITDVLVLPLTNDSNAVIMNQQTSNNQNGYINEIRKFLSSGVFYFAHPLEPNISFDLTLSAQSRHLMHHTNKKFLWNFGLHLPFRRLGVDVDQWLLKIICGCVEIKKIITLGASYKACIFSRLSCERVGTRFNCRGVNDDGNVANFVETEQIVYSVDTNEETSFIQIRGSVPVFFEQSGLQVGSHRIKLSRSTHACHPAFERHIKSLMQDYGSQIFVLNLLGIKGDEQVLTNFFHYLCQLSPFSMTKQLSYANYDYHQELKLNKHSLGEKLWPYLINNFYKDNHVNNSTEGMFFSIRLKKRTNDYSSSFEETSVDFSNKNIATLQTKFVRTNCMDCLDRTNSVQSFIGLEMLQYQLREIMSDSDLNKFRDVFHKMWIINGDCISKIYAGTGAIQGKSMTQDLSRSLTRAIQNNFLDNNKQDAIETFLYSMSRNYGLLADRVKVLMSQTFLRLPYSILKEVVTNKNQYVEKVKCRVCIGTWNINGGFSLSDMEQVNVAEWLFDGPANAKRTGLGYLDPSVQSSRFGDIDIFAIGFEEIVDLTAQNIVNSSDENATLWYKKIIESLNREGNYVQLIAENLQLVGVCLFVFVLKKHVPFIRDVCISKTKTGFGGTAGNKGGVLLRFIYYNTSMCFVCSHFAAHQKEIKQRNEDFRQIYEQSEFVGQAVTTSSKIEVKNHDYVFWCGDLNYRIDMPNDRCRSLITEGDWNTLLSLDQLTVQRNEQNVFREFHEAPISFPPTYKYNVLEDTYDRSEKCRVPAWTDRILWRRRLTAQESQSGNVNTGKCLYYGRSDIRYSDHRPVSALLEVEVSRVEPKKLIEVLNRIFLTSHGSFQLVLLVTNDKNQMDEKIKAETLKLFSRFNSYGMTREFKNVIYVTYTDAKYGYEAYAQLNNHYLANFDLTLQVKVENEQSYQKLIEHELMDCLISLNYINDSLRKHSVNAFEAHEVQVADLLGEDFKYEEENDSFKSFLNLPSQLHTNLSITDNMHQLNAKNPDVSPKHLYHNPMVKALSNSNLTILSENLQIGKANPNSIHSVVNLLDLSNDDQPTEKKSDNNVNAFPPKRPPPPPSSLNINSNSNSSSHKTFRDIFGGDQIGDYESPIDQTDEETSSIISAPLICIDGGLNNEEKNLASSSSVHFGFDDDFSSYNPNDPFQSQTVQKAPILPPRPPPLPPQPTQPSKTTFSLFDDDFNHNEVKSTTSNQTAKLLDNSTPISTVPLVPVRPPPLPPMPQTVQKQQANSYFNELTTVLGQPQPPATNTTNNQLPPPLPPRPAIANLPPALPPMNRPPSNSYSTFESNNNNKNFNFNAPNNNTDTEFDLFGNLVNKPKPQLPPPPLPPPPPRPNHFN